MQQTDQLTISEALAETKTINRRLAKKRDAILGHLARDAKLTDPMPDVEGGVVEFIKRERQAARDLEARLVQIRSAIQRSNLEVKLTVAGVELSVQDWLNWRREVSDGYKKFLEGMRASIALNRTEALRRGYAVQGQGEGALPAGAAGSLIVHVSEAELAAESEKLETILGELDGKLSYLNATTTIQI